MKKGIITTTIGLLAVIGIAYKIYTSGGLDVQDAIYLLFAAGLIAAKDINGTHTK